MMFLSNKTLIASSCTLLFTVPAMAGASLDTLLGGDTLFSNNGKILFSDFQFTPILNAPQASDIEVVTLDDGLLFETPVSADSNTTEIDFDISYKASGVDVLLNSVQMQSAGSATGGGTTDIYKTVEDERNEGILALTNAFDDSTQLSFTESGFSSEAYVYVTDEVSVDPNDGTAGLSEFSQTFGSTSVSAVPTPTAALAGMALLGVVGIRRRRPAK